MSERERCVRVIEVGPRLIRSIRWSPDGTRLAYRAFGGMIGALDDDGRVLWASDLGSGIGGALAWSPNGEQVAITADPDGAVVILWAADGLEVRRFEGPPSTPHGLSWSPDGRSLQWWRSEEEGHVTKLAAVVNGSSRELAELPGWAAGVNVSPDGSRLAVHYYSLGRVEVLRADSGERLFSAEVKRPFQVDWSPDGHRLLVNAEGRVEVWEVASARRLLTAAPSDSEYSTASWAARGGWFAAGCVDGSVRVCEADGREVLCLRGHTSWVTSVAFSPSGGVMASACHDGTIRLWDISDLDPRRADAPTSAEAAYLRRHALSVGRRPRALATRDARVPRLEGADEATGCLGVLPKAGYRLTLSDDSCFLFSASGREAQCWRLEDGQFLWRSPLPGVVTSGLAASSEGSRLAVATDAGGLSVLNARTGAVVWSSEHAFALSVAWSPDGARLASGHRTGKVRIWSAAGAEEMVLSGDRDNVWGVSWSPDGAWLASASGHALHVWEARSGQLTRSLRAHTANVVGVAWSPDGRVLASCGHDQTVRVWEVSAGVELSDRVRHGEAVLGVAWSPDGRLLASCSAKGVVLISEAGTGRERRRLQADRRVAHSICWARSGNFLAVAGGDGVSLWDVRDLLDTPAAPAMTGDAPPSLRVLPAALAALTRAGLTAPLGLLRGLLELAAGRAPDGPLAPLSSHPGPASLASLHWPEPARLGLAALLLHRCAFPAEWLPPDGLTPAQLRDRLAAALADADDVPPEHGPAPLPLIEAALDEIDERLLGLLRLVGPDAVAADPLLPVRLLPHAKVVAPNAARPRRLPAAPGEGQVAAQPSPWGVGRSGVATRGSWRSLLPWQLTLPPDALAARHRRGELLFRAGEAREGGAAGPLVILLDTSPANYGPVEAVTRACASACASAWQARGEPVWLVTTAGAAEVRELRSPADLPAVWTARSTRPARAAEALRAATRLLRGLGPAGRVLLLAHAWFGWDEEPPESPTLRALFVHLRGRRNEPPWAGACRRWALVPAGGIDAAVRALGDVLA